MTETGCLRTDVLVIGAGQAGLAAAYALSAAGLSFLLVDACKAVGDSWRIRYDSLTLFTPRSISALPGMSVPGDPDGYPSKDEFADYLARYTTSNAFNVITSAEVKSLTKEAAVFVATLGDGRCIASTAVIVAIGAFVKPFFPAVSKSIARSVQQRHVSELRNLDDVGEGTIVVVGDGASGRDVARALATSHQVILAQGRSRRLLPERILGRSVWWWLKRLGLLQASFDGVIGRRMRAADPFPGRGNDDASLIGLGVALKPRLISSQGERLTFADGSSEVVRTIVWATGYSDDFRWIEIEGAADIKGAAVHSRGISPVEGLYHVGRPWQRNRASGLIAGVGDDAAFVVEHLRRHFL